MTRRYAFFGIGLVLLAILFSGCVNNSANHRKAKLEPQRKPLADSDSKINSGFVTPSVSGAVNAFPWDNDPKFKKAQKDNHDTVLMAGFCTVLRDPLPGEESNVHLGARMLAGMVVKPGQVFSQNQAIGPYNQSRGFRIGPVYVGNKVSRTVGGGVCKLASTLYNVTVLSDLSVIERHAHRMPVPYVPYGQDATVSYGTNDFKFKNTSSSPIMIWAQGVDNRLYMAFYGVEKAPKVKWHHQVLKTIKTYNTYRTNSNLPENTERTVIPGMDGGTIKSWVTVTYPDGTSRTRDLGKSYYNCLPSLIEKGTAKPTH